MLLKKVLVYTFDIIYKFDKFHGRLIYLHTFQMVYNGGTKLKTNKYKRISTACNFKELFLFVYYKAYGTMQFFQL